MSDTQRDREERQHVIEVLQKMVDWMQEIDDIATPERIHALFYAIASIKTDLRYDLLYEETSGQADKPTTKDYLGVDYLGVDAVSREAVQTRLKEIINEMETIFADIREREVNDSVCGLCEYDCDHGLDGFANECPGFEKDDCFKLNEKYRAEWLDISNMPSVTPQEPFINKPCVSSGVCEHDKLKVLEKIREQIKSHLRGVEITLEVLVENDPLRPKMEGAKDTLEECLELIDRAESEG